MHEIKSGSVDFIFTSPPYNLNTSYDAYQDSRRMEAYRAFISSIVGECSRVIKSDGSIAFNIPEFVRKDGEVYYYPKIYEEIFRDHQLERACVVFWVKINADNLLDPSHKWDAQSKAIANDLHSVTEWIMVFQKKPLSPREVIKDEVVYLKRNPCKDEHPAVWPQALPEHLIKKFTSQGQLVLDPFMGIGTTGAACRALSREFIGYDISRDYCELAKRHVQANDMPKNTAKES
jgi:DNA modification methylase